jgi:DNA-binding MarR family transcriptional regulator
MDSDIQNALQIPGRTTVTETGLLVQMRAVGRAIRREVAARAEALDLTPAQLHVLWLLWQEDGVLTSRLADASGPDLGTITGLLDRLEAKGLIRRERCAEDRRAVRVHLTPAGRRLEAPVGRILAEVDALALAGLGRAEVARLRKSLERIGENLGAQ